MLVVDRALIREVFATSSAVALVFIALFMVVSLVKVLGQAAAGEIPVGIVFTVLGLQTIKTLGLMLPLAFYVGIILALGRWYRDSEMTVLAACGVGLMHFLRPVLLLALVFSGIVALFSFYLGPIASDLLTKVRSDDSSRYEVSGVAPGVFNELKRGTGGVYYVEAVSKDDAVMENVFASHVHQGRHGVLIAKTGQRLIDEKTGDQFLLLKNGTRYEGTPGSADYRVVNFESYAVRIEPQAGARTITGFEALRTWQLVSAKALAQMAEQARDKRVLPLLRAGAAAELHSRIAKPVALFLLSVLALVFAYVNPRHGRYLSLAIAILAYFFYNTLLGIGDGMLKRGQIPGGVGLWWVHALFLALAVYLLWRRANNRSLVPKFARRR